MAIVTISRLLGSGGDDIASKVAEGLGYNLVDNALIVKVAEQAGVKVEDAIHVDEKYQSKVTEWLKAFITPRMGKILTNKGVHLDPESFVEYCKEVISGLAEKGNVVIVGRAAQFILKDRDNAFHVRIVANKKYRIEQVKTKKDISDDNALDQIKKSDHMRKQYIERYLKSNWEDPLAYHLIIDASKLGLDAAVSVIVNAVEDFSKTHEYIPGVKDRRKDARRKDEQRKGSRRMDKLEFTSKDIGHTIMRDGRPVRSLIKPERRKSGRRKTIRRTSSKKTGEH